MAEADMQLTEFVPEHLVGHKLPDGNSMQVPALLAFRYPNTAVRQKFFDLVLVGEAEKRAGFAGYRDLDRWQRILFRPDPAHEEAVAISTHYTSEHGDGYYEKPGTERTCYFDLNLVDKDGYRIGDVTDPYQIEKAKSLCLDLLRKKNLVSEETASYVQKQPCTCAKAAAQRFCNVNHDNKTSLIKRDHPKAILWLESSLTAFHINHMAQLSRSLQAKGFEVSILTSEDTMKKFAENGGQTTADGHCASGSEIDFGKDAKFLPYLPSQTTYNQPDIPKVSIYCIEPFNFIGSPEIIERRNAAIASVMEKEKPDALVTSLWPGGYGPFDEEVKKMIKRAKENNPGCKIYSLTNDIPYLDREFNYRHKRRPMFEELDRAFVRGDGTIRYGRYIPLSRKAADTLNHVGHFVEPLPARTQIPDKKRKVLVTYGTKESQWNGDRYEAYFTRILEAAPRTEISHLPWELVVGPGCSPEEFGRISATASKIAKSHHMNIKVRRGVPDKAFRQEIADAAFRICQYDIFVLDEVSTGVPALVTTGNIGQYTCGARDGEERLANLSEIGAPISYFDQYRLDKPWDVAARINTVWEEAHTSKKGFTLPINAPDRVTDVMLGDYQQFHKVASDYGLSNAGEIGAVTGMPTPDPVLGSSPTITPQNSSLKQERTHG